jgi:hypothetical protein
MKPEPGTQRPMSREEAEAIGFDSAIGYVVEVDAEGGVWVLEESTDGHRERSVPGGLASNDLERFWERG